MVKDRSLYDEVRAIMVNELIRSRREAFAKGFRPGHPEIDYSNRVILLPETPYNYYGQRGSVDLVEYLQYPSDDPVCGGKQEFQIYEVYSRIFNLEETLRKLREKSEVFPKYFQDEYKMPLPDDIWSHLVLLNSQENVNIISAYM